MLIVVITIGILAVAILPRISWYLAMTRDMKRKTDLINLAAAISTYKNTKGMLPLLWNEDWLFPKRLEQFVGNASDLSYELWEYLSQVPTNPSKRMLAEHLTMNYWPFIKSDSTTNHRAKFIHYRKLLKAGEYLYQTYCKTNRKCEPEWALLASPVETPDAANFIALETDNESKWRILNCSESSKILGTPRGRISSDPRNNWKVYPVFMSKNCLQLCTSVTKWETPKMEVKANGEVMCVYSDKKQLYRIIVIE